LFMTITSTLVSSRQSEDWRLFKSRFKLDGRLQVGIRILTVSIKLTSLFLSGNHLACLLADP